MIERKIQNVQALRGVAVLLVLVRHLYVMERNYGGGEMWLPAILKVGDAGVDLFFVISGFVMVWISRGRFQRSGEFWAFLYRRATRIFPLYWLFSLLVLAVFLVSPAWVPAMQKGQVHLLASFLLLPQLVLPLLGPGWTLDHEAYFYFVFALALLLPERRLSLFLLLWGLAVAVGSNLYFRQAALLDNAAIKMITNPLTIEFVGGALVALAIRRGWRHGDWLCLIGGGLLLPLSHFFFDPLDVEGLRFFCFGLPAVLIVYGAVSLESRARVQFPRWLQSVGDASFSIYLSHILVIEFVGRIWRGLGMPGLWGHVAALWVMTVAALGFGFAVYWWVEQPLLRVCHRWASGRKTPPITPHAGVVSP